MTLVSAAFLATAFATHALVGAALGGTLFDRPGVGALAGLAADADFLFPAALGPPFVHRGITHSLPALLALAAAATAVWYAVDARGSHRAAGATVAVAYCSHLLIDVTTPEGIPPLSPLSDRVVGVALPTTGHSPVPTLLLWTGSLWALWRTDALDPLARRVTSSRGDD
ncbi:metal-dependent hydrolase [Halorubrum sodomense]|uniref:Inner membrane protein n=1 Tax=Halorubrum sodomense TaxID=35743 RepID=A0A1I6FQQ0_HALSD|nr:metal-dependent hydrolase [Halorubrum sodomense]SFR32280.1 inner membrane protein [Halorubrum sodomense]